MATAGCSSSICIIGGGGGFGYSLRSLMLACTIVEYSGQSAGVLPYTGLRICYCLVFVCLFVCLFVVS